MNDDLLKMRLEGLGLEKDGLYWSEEDRQKLLNGFYEAIGISELAMMLQRSETAIIQQLNAEHCYENAKKKRKRCAKTKEKCICIQCAEFERCAYSPVNRKENQNVGDLP